MITFAKLQSDIKELKLKVKWLWIYVYLSAIFDIYTSDIVQAFLMELFFN